MPAPYRGSSLQDWDLPPAVPPDSRSRFPLVLAAVAALAIGFFGFAAYVYGFQRTPRPASVAGPTASTAGNEIYAPDGKIYVDTTFQFMHIQDAAGAQIGHARVLVQVGGPGLLRLP